MGIIQEFKQFALKGNIVDLAIAVVIGAAFGKVVTALTDSIIMPIISLVLGKRSMEDISFSINKTVFPIGIFFQSVIDFILIAMVLFFIIKLMNTLNRKKEEAPKAPELSMTEKLLMDIKEVLAGKNLG